MASVVDESGFCGRTSTKHPLGVDETAFGGWVSTEWPSWWTEAVFLLKNFPKTLPFVVRGEHRTRFIPRNTLFRVRNGLQMRFVPINYPWRGRGCSLMWLSRINAPPARGLAGRKNTRYAPSGIRDFDALKRAFHIFSPIGKSPRRLCRRLRTRCRPRRGHW